MDEQKKPEETTVPLPELPESQLDKVVGGTGAEAGKPSVSEIVITKVVDTATSSLFQQATAGSTGTTGTATTDTVIPTS